MFYFWREATAALVPGFLCQSGRRRPENVSILSSLMDPRPRHQTRDPRPSVKLEFVLVSLLIFFFFETSVKKEKKGVQISGLKNIAHRSIGMICSRRLFVA